MKIAILSRNKHLYSTHRLLEAGRQAGHEMHVIDTLRCYMSMVSHKPEIHFKGEVLEGFDAVIPGSVPPSPSTVPRCCASSR